MNSSELIVVEQLPVIRQRLENIRDDVKAKADSVLILDCNENTVKEIKALRADLNKDYADFESRRKEVKNIIMSPYEKFNAVYKECVAEVYETTDAELKKRIDFVENEDKAKKKSEVLEYFEECKTAAGVDFIKFDDANINVTKTASLKSLKTAAKAFVDRVADDLRLIKTQDHAEEILFEYKKHLSVSTAIRGVCERHKAIEKEIQKVQDKPTESDIDEKTPEVLHKPLSAPEVHDDKIYRMSFTVEETKPRLKKLKEFLISNGYKII